MMQLRLSPMMVCSLFICSLGAEFVQGQQEIGFIEKFATATDRRTTLQELIPGTEDYFYFHCLHYQNEGQLADARATLDAWRTQLGDTGRASNMLTRQALLEYASNPKQALNYLRTELGLKLDHAPPSRDRAATLPDKFDNSQLDIDRLIDAALVQDRSLNQFPTNALGLLLNRKLSVEQLRALVGRLERADFPGVVAKIAEELALKDSRGFGWASLHSQLTLTQLQELQRLRPELLEVDAFVRATTARLVPPEGTSLTDKVELRAYLERLLSWARTLPPSQNSLRALALGNLLRLDMSENKYDRAAFIEYLKLPRAAPYYEPKQLTQPNVATAQLSFVMNPQVPLPAMGDDSPLVRRYLEHFLQSQERTDDFAPYLRREYLESVLAQTKILYGLGDETTWYSKLSPSEQKEVRERTELRFAPHSQTFLSSTDEVQLDVELKNVDQLTVKIYEINLLNYYRNHTEPLNTAIDLDGLIPNYQKQFNYSQPPQRRHAGKINLPELAGRGAWVVDLLGAGQRSRALIQKGQLLAFERLGDAGHVFRIIDEQGNKVPSAHLELNGRKFSADEQGMIVLPYSEKTVARNLLLVDDSFACQLLIAHRAEAYKLEASFLLDRQSLVAGKQAAMLIRSQLTCNGRPSSIRLLESSKLTMVATDTDGITTSQTMEDLDLDDSDEFMYTFLVPPRLASLSMVLSGQVTSQSRGSQENVDASYSINCNGIQRSHQIADFFLRETAAGYQLLVLGRNGEPIPKLPVEIAFSLKQITQPQNFTLVTNAAGEVDLGVLSDVTQFRVSATAVQSSSFVLSKFHRDWPSTIQLGKGEMLELPLGKDSAATTQFSLYEVRRGVAQAWHSQNISVAHGSLKIRELAPGDYHLRDHETGQQIEIRVGDIERSDNLVVGKNRLLEASSAATVVIREAKLENGQLVVRVDGADAMTRIHIVADALMPDASSSRQLELPRAPLMQQRVPQTQSHYVDSLKLDEEYSYILDRQGQKKFPGNLLPQPTILVHPWEVSVTENLRQDAAAGDAMPKSMAAPAPSDAMQPEAEPQSEASRPDWKSFDFLSVGNVIIANLGLTDGQTSVPVEQLAGCSNLTIIAVHPTAMDSRQVTRTASELQTRDQRLRKAFDSSIHLSQVQTVEQLAAGEVKTLGDPRTRRYQVYATIADVFQLYSTLLANPEWEKFRFVGQWQELSKDEQLSRYNEMACHELNFFLYHKDRKFFDSVIAPLIKQKLDKQLVDHWLLGNSLASYHELWRVQRSNTLERILLAERIASQKPGTHRWLNDYLQAHPMPAESRQQRFEVALRGNTLSSTRSAGAAIAMSGGVSSESLALGEMFDSAAVLDGRAQQSNLNRSRRLGRAASPGKEADKPQASADYFGVDRLGRKLNEFGFFQSLDKTREWAETQYHQIRLADQSPLLIPINTFWQEFLTADAKPFLPQNLDLPCSSITEALCALAVIDLPLKRSQPELVVEDEQLVLKSETAAVVYLESIESTAVAAADKQPSILVGEELYLAHPSTDEESNRPVGVGSLLTGVPYRASVVVTNPSNRKQSVQLLTQLPAGSLPLAGSKLTRSHSLDLEPYTTSQVEYLFYFPQPGEFAHYGSQISNAGEHIVATEARSHRVAVEPEAVDETTWSYVADWGTDAQVLKYLAAANLQRLDLSRIAFRMHDQDFYAKVTELLAASGHFEASLWAYAVAHDDQSGIAQLLQNRPDFLSRLGVAFDSPLVRLVPQEQMSYEHLDYKPLVVARTHRLGRQQTILNPRLHAQYHRLLEFIAHERSVSNDQRLQLCYYLLLQSRIEEALAWFDSVDKDLLETQLQYDYFDAFLDFYRGRYARAAQIAARYTEYPVVRWSQLFAQIRAQVSARELLLAGSASRTTSNPGSATNRTQRLLTDSREQLLAAQAEATPTIDLETVDGRASLRYRNVRLVQVNYYLMDIELLFSRNPFVSQAGKQVPAIRPNLSQELELEGSDGLIEIELPETMRNRNVLVEVTVAGISKSSLLTANSLAVSVAEPAGRLQVLSRNNKTPVSAAYVKVFAQHRDGAVQFYKDGYSDLSGNFDYATLSTADLDSVERLAILVLDQELGAIVREASPPTR